MSDDDPAGSFGELERKLEALERELESSRRAATHHAGDDAPARTAGDADDHRAGASSPFAAALLPSAAAPLEPPPADPAPSDASPQPPPAVWPAAAAPAARVFTACPPEPARPLKPGAVVPNPELARSIGDARAELGDLHARFDELVRFREELERSATELAAKYDRLLTGLREVVERDQRLAAVGPGLNTALLDGVVTVDAGPFTDMARLAELEQALARVPGARDVHVRSFERGRASIDVILGEPVAVGAALRATSTLAFTLTRAAAGHVSIELT